MKRSFKAIVTALVVLAVAGSGYALLVGPNPVGACGWGSPGGQDYVPQERNSAGPLAQTPTLTNDQAYDIVERYVKKLNPDLKVGRINDAGSFFEAEILSKDKEVIQLVGVDKKSGRLMLIN